MHSIIHLNPLIENLIRSDSDFWRKMAERNDNTNVYCCKFTVASNVMFSVVSGRYSCRINQRIDHPVVRILTCDNESILGDKAE